MAGDVFEEDPVEAGAEFPGDPCNIGPEVALIVGAPALAGGAERLAGVSGEKGPKAPAKGFASKVVTSSQIGAGARYPARWAAMRTDRGYSSHST
jgi:hypothetical protein